MLNKWHASGITIKILRFDDVGENQALEKKIMCAQKETKQQKIWKSY
jgi:hypothetical protein